MYQPRFNIDAKGLRIGNYTFPQNAGIVNSALVFQSDGNLGSDPVPIIGGSGAVPYAVAQWNGSGQLTSSTSLTSDVSNNLFLKGLQFPNQDGNTNQLLATNGSGVLEFINPGGASSVIGTGLSGRITVWNSSSTITYCPIGVNLSGDVTNIGTIDVQNAATIAGLAYPTSDGANQTVLTTNGAGSLSFLNVTSISGVITGTGINDRLTRWNGSDNIQDSLVTVTDSGSIYGVTDLNASGTTTLAGISYPTSDGTTGQSIVTNGSGVLSFTTPLTGAGISGQLSVWNSSGTITNSNITVDSSTNVGGIGDLTVTGTASLTGITYPTIDGTNGQGLFTDGSGSLDFRSVAAGISGTLDKSIFGTLLSIAPEAQVQIDALRGYLDDIHETFTATGGSVTIKSDHNGREFQCRTGTSIGGYGLIRSIPAVRYKPGQGVTLMFTARFAPPVALLAQRAGGIASGCELSFGHDGSNGYGILYRTGGRLEIRRLTISSAAGGSETALITLNGTTYSANLTTGTIAHNTYEIATNTSFAAAWQSYQNDGTVTFISNAVGSMSGAYTFSSATATGAFTQIAAGTPTIDTWVYQAGWDNSDPFNGITVDPTKGNIYKIVFGYLGYSRIDYYMMHPTAHTFIKVHTIPYVNTKTNPNIDSPYFKLGWFAASLGSTTDSSVYGSSACGFLDGLGETSGALYSASNTKNVGTTLTNIVSIRVRPELNTFINFSEILPKILSIAADGTKPIVCEIYRNATLGGEPNWQYVDQNSSAIEFDTAATTVSGTKKLITITVGKTDSQLIDLVSFKFTLYRNQTLTIAAKATTSTSDVTASVGWVED